MAHGQKTRYHGFFIESFCGVLLYDMVREPATYAYNMGFLRTALGAMSSMVDDEPIVTSIQTTRQIAEAIEKAVMAVPTPSTLDNALLTGGGASRALDALGGSSHPASLRFPVEPHPRIAGLATPAVGEPLVYLHERGLAPAGPHEGPLVPSAAPPPPPFDAAVPLGPSPVDFSAGLDFDILATDLFNFFPSGYAGAEDLAQPPPEVGE